MVGLLVSLGGEEMMRATLARPWGKGTYILSREEEDLEGGCDNGTLRDGGIYLTHCDSLQSLIAQQGGTWVEVVIFVTNFIRRQQSQRPGLCM